MSKFQVIVLGIFAVCIVGGVIAFATYKGSQSSTSLPAINVWGTFPANTFNSYISQISVSLPTPIRVTYKQFAPNDFSPAFIAALARGVGPDAILIDSSMILPHEDKLSVIPFSALSQRTFMDTFINEGQVYLSDSGSYALPFVVDPLIMYWNRDMYNTAGIATYPRYWDEFAGINKKITQKDTNGNIRTSAIAMGDFMNVDNAREILGSLILQLGNPVTIRDTLSTGLKSTIKQSSQVDPTPAFSFFTQFVNPNNANYSWNRGMQDSKTAFLSSTLATYFGFASEISEIREKNPNLNFDAALLPQLRKGGVKTGYGKMYGLSIVKSGADVNGTYQILSLITQPLYLESLSNSMYLPSVLNSVIAKGSSDPYLSIFDNAALVTRTWLDIDPLISGGIFNNVIESITSGRNSIYDALNTAGLQYDELLSRVMQ